MPFTLVPQTNLGHVLVNLFFVVFDWCFLVILEKQPELLPAYFFYPVYVALLCCSAFLGSCLLRWLWEQPWMTASELIQIMIGASIGIAVCWFELQLLGYPGGGLTIGVFWVIRLLLRKATPSQPA